jgi:hypothetical protein
MSSSLFRNAFLSSLVLVVGGLAGCSGPGAESADEKLITQNNFDQLEGWVPPVAGLTTERAHSGRYATKVDAATPYSLGYITTLGQASPVKLKKILVSAWILRTGPQALASIVVELKNPSTGQGIYWKALDVTKDVHDVNVWEEVSQVFELPENIEATHELRVYLWGSTTPQPVFMDDITISRD